MEEPEESLSKNPNRGTSNGGRRRPSQEVDTNFVMNGLKGDLIGGGSPMGAYGGVDDEEHISVSNNLGSRNNSEFDMPVGADIFQLQVRDGV